ncbi:MAG: hypothetical protein H7281_01355 [Bacteriovorax sp.]|nr:hypothetical protein [Bacteriovorax sp.]
MKILKYFGMILAIAGIFYAKSKIDAHNKSNIQALDSLDDGNDSPPKIKKKGVINTP